ncbi:MAG: hypothetical protein ABSB15_13710 [Bryobacteraceae bacterium]|jgi:hypothetical protein
MNALIVLALFLVLLVLSWPTLLQLIAALRLQDVPQGAGRPDSKTLKHGPAA